MKEMQFYEVVSRVPFKFKSQIDKLSQELRFKPGFSSILPLHLIAME